MTDGLVYLVLFLLIACFQYTGGFPVSPSEKCYRINRVGNGLKLSAELEAQSMPRQKDPTSYISIIRSNNIAGVYADEAYNDVVIDLRTENSINSMVAVSGETGSGKSLLVSKVADLVTGGKLDMSLLQRPSKNGQSKEVVVSAEMGKYLIIILGLR